MIDNDDAEFLALASMTTTGWWSLILLIGAVVFWVIASGNERDCAADTRCPAGTHGKLVENECICVARPGD